MRTNIPNPFGGIYRVSYYLHPCSEIGFGLAPCQQPRSMGSTSYFVIVSREDHPIYEADLGTGNKVRLRSSRTIIRTNFGEFFMKMVNRSVLW